MASTPPYGARTPEYGAKTPEYEEQAPKYGAKTPEYGAKTPEYGAKTPTYGNTGSTTPKYGARTPTYGNTGSTTPKYGAKTPTYGNTGAKTPTYGNTSSTAPKYAEKAKALPYPNQMPPFYNEVTPIKEEYTTDQGFTNSVELPIVTLPPGTLLFRGVTIPDIEGGKEDIRYFYRDYVGDPYGKDQVCLSPSHNVFFYPFPYVSFGAHNIGVKFKCIQIVVLIKPMKVGSAIGPYRIVRAQTWIYTGDAPFKRCSMQPLYCKDKLSDEDMARAKEASLYDSCLSPEYQQRSGTRGWMALAQLDTLKPIDGSLSTMAKYIVGLSKRIPSAASELMAFMYKDFYSPMKYTVKDKEVNLESSGYPEIALYPYAKHHGNKTTLQYCKDAKTAENIITQHIKSDDLNYLPIAMITRKGILNILGGDDDYFSYDRLQANASIFGQPAEVQQHVIERYLHDYLNVLKKYGVTLPYYGPGKLRFDTRTGFFVLPQLVADPVYQSYLRPLDSVKADHVALAYSIMVRNYSKEHMGSDIVINPEVSIPRSFIFSRPASMMNIVKVLKVQLPGIFLEYLSKGSELFKKEGSSNKALQLYLPPEIQKVKLPGLLPGYKSNVFSPPSPTNPVVGDTLQVTQGDLTGLIGKLVKINQDGTFLLQPSAESASELGLSVDDQLEVRSVDVKVVPNSGKSTPYHPLSPVYQPKTPESPAYHPKTPESPAYHPKTPESPPYRPRTPELKGGRTRSKKVQKKRVTRKRSDMGNYKSVFTNMWKAHAGTKYKAIK